MTLQIAVLMTVISARLFWLRVEMAKADRLFDMMVLTMEVDEAISKKQHKEKNERRNRNPRN